MNLSFQNISDIIVYFNLQKLEFMVVSALGDILIYELIYVHLFLKERFFGLFGRFFSHVRFLLQSTNHVLLLWLLANALSLIR